MYKQNGVWQQSMCNSDSGGENRDDLRGLSRYIGKKYDELKEKDPKFALYLKEKKDFYAKSFKRR